MTRSERVGKLDRIRPLRAVGLLVLCVVAIVYLFPLFWLLDSSFRAAMDIFQVPPVIFKKPLLEAIQSYTLDSFKAAFVNWNVGWAFFISVVVTLAGIGLTLLICSLCAYAFAYLDFPGKSALFLVILGTMMLPMTTMIVPYYKVIRVLHLSNNLLGLIIPYAVSAFGVFLLRQYYIKIPRALIESAKLEGASHLRIWWNVITPLSKPALAALAIVQFRLIWNDFLYPIIILRSETIFTLPVRIQVMDSQHFNKPYDAIISTGFIATLIPVVFFLIFQKQFIEGLAGGIKE